MNKELLKTKDIIYNIAVNFEIKKLTMLNSKNKKTTRNILYIETEENMFGGYNSIHLTIKDAEKLARTILKTITKQKSLESI